MTARADPSKLALLIDADNVSATYAEYILTEVKRFGTPSVTRVYGDWSDTTLAKWKRAAPEYGLVLNQQTANTTGKNASDIGLVIDAMDIMHEGRIGTFVLVSSDSDFTRLASRIREWGLTVIGIGEAKAPDSLKNACDRFVALENIKGQAKARRKANEVEALVVAALDKADGDQDWCTLSWLGKQLRLDNPDFDQRTYGHAKLSGLIGELKNVETKTNESALTVVRMKT